MLSALSHDPQGRKLLQLIFANCRIESKNITWHALTSCPADQTSNALVALTYDDAGQTVLAHILALAFADEKSALCTDLQTQLTRDLLSGSGKQMPSPLFFLAYVIQSSEIITRLSQSDTGTQILGYLKRCNAEMATAISTMLNDGLDDIRDDGLSDQTTVPGIDNDDSSDLDALPPLEHVP